MPDTTIYKKEAISAYFDGEYQDFYGKYTDLKPSSNGRSMTLCPFHSDKNPSLSINNGTGQFKCFGCNKSGDIFSFYGEVHNLNTNGHFPEILKGIAEDFGIAGDIVMPRITEKPTPKTKIVEISNYTDVNGNILHQTVRMEPKDFRQRAPNGNGKFMWSLKGVDTVLYNLPAVIKADEVIVVEGEKDADTLIDLGFCATTNAMGAGKWQDTYTQALAGKHVVMISDNDKAGRDRNAMLSEKLAGQVGSLKIIELYDLPEHGDVTDFIEGFKYEEDANERLCIMIEGAETYSPPEPTDEPVLTRIRLVHNADLIKGIEKADWLRGGGK